MSNTTLEQDLSVIGTYISGLAKAQKKTLRQIAKDTSLSINSVKVVFSGKPGNVTTYDTVARYLGSSFIEAVMSSTNGSIKSNEAVTSGV